MNEIYKNNFGKVDKDNITLTIQNRKQKIALKNITKIEFIKRQKLHMNYTAFLLATYLLFFIEKNKMSSPSQAITLLFVAILLVTSVYIRQFQYKLIITKKNDFIAITVTKKLSQDADAIAQQTKKQIATENITMTATENLSQATTNLGKQTTKQIATETIAMAIN